jgi:spore maturation protein CgeB
MAEMGHCPSGRLFEAAACGAPLLSDWWTGLDEFFVPGSEILVANSTEQAVAALQCSDDQLAKMARSAQARTLEEHTADHRARELEAALVTAHDLDGPAPEASDMAATANLAEA